MKKTLVALAALASVSAFAQVTLSGNFDIATTKVGFDDPLATTTLQQRKGTTVGSYGTASTSTINMMAEEDLGGGLKAAGRLELDPRASLGDGGALALHSSYVGIMGNFGAIKFGRMDSAAVLANGQQSPLGTGVGSGYSVLQSTVIAATRYNRSIKFESATYGGISGSVMYTPGVNGDGVTITSYAGMPIQRSATEIGLAYAQGPLAASFINLNTGAGNGTTTLGTVGPIAYTTAALSPSTSTNILTAQYTMGNSSFHFGYNRGQTAGLTSAVTTSGLYDVVAVAAGLDTSGRRLGYKYVMGDIDLIAQTGQQKIATTTASVAYNTRKVSGLRAVKNLSKNTAVYIGYEAYNSGTNLASTAASIDGGRYTITSLGIKKAF
jgi:predicted porin